MTNRTILGYLITLIAISFPGSAMGQDLAIHLAAPRPETAQMLAIVRKDIGCSPCAEVTSDGPPDRGVLYLMNPKPLVTVGPDEIESAFVQELHTSSGQKEYQLMVRLSPPAAGRIRSVSGFPVKYTANFSKGRFLGIGSLIARDEFYLVGTLSSRKQADTVASSLSKKVEFIPYDPTRQRRIKEQLEKARKGDPSEVGKKR